MDIRKMKMKAPQKKGNARPGPDAPYIKPGGSGFHSGGGSHGSASGPYRMVPSSPSPLGPAPSNKPMPHKQSGLMERYNKEWQRSRERGETIPSNLYGKKRESPLVKAACASDNSAPYGRNRPAASSRSNRPGGTAASPNKGAGRARGVNIWYANKGIDASGDSGESQRRGDKESESRGTSGDMD